MEGLGTSKINDLTIRGIENLQWLNYFAPQIILPEKTADFSFCIVIILLILKN
jgi:hypothetical protein